MTTYRRALFLADVLRRADLHVVEEAGWKTRGRPISSGSFDPRAFLLHHDASRVGESIPEGKNLVRDGRSDLAGPLSQLYYSYGTFYVLASGRANHAGVGPGWGVVGKNLGNALAIGCEWDHTTGETVTAHELADLTRGAAAILDALAADPFRACMGHREYAPGRKTDPAAVDLVAYRRNVAAAISELRRARGVAARPAVSAHTTTAPRPVAPAFPLPAGHFLGTTRADARCHSGALARDRDAVASWQRRMRALGYPIGVDGRFGDVSARTARAYALKLGEQNPRTVVTALEWRAAWTGSLK